MSNSLKGSSCPRPGTASVVGGMPMLWTLERRSGPAFQYGLPSCSWSAHLALSLPEVVF